VQVSLPKDIETRQPTRYNLFTCNYLLSTLILIAENIIATPPKITSQPTIHSLPLLSSSSSDANLKTAIRLLSLPPKSTYPPTSPHVPKPYLEISKSGHISVAVDPIRRKVGSPSSTSSSSGSNGRREFLIILEFEVPCIKSGMNGIKVLD